MDKKWWVLASVACGTFMAALDSSIVNIALPTLTHDLATTMDQVKWVVILYLLVITCLLLPFGRLSDQLGRKGVFQGGYWVFTLGSLVCTFSPGLHMLVAARLLQGIGASMLMANGPAIITAAFPADGRGGALGVMSMVVSAGLISGPGLGGLLISYLGWRSIFLVNVPFGVAGIILVQRFLDPDPEPEAGVPFDWMGSILQSVLLLTVIFLFDPSTLSFFSEARWAAKWMNSPLSRLMIGGLIVAMCVVFLRVEARARAPLFDLSLMKIRTFWTSNLASLLTFVAFSTVSILMPFFLEQAMHLPPHVAGAFMTAIPVTILVIAPLSGRLSDKVGCRGLSVAGALVGALDLLAMAGEFGPGLTQNAGAHAVVLGLAAIGLALGLFQSPNNNAIMGAVPLAKLGVASALLATIRNLGLVIGTALAMGIFSWKMDLTHGDFVHSLHFTYLIGAGVAVLAGVAAFGKKEA